MNKCSIIYRLREDIVFDEKRNVYTVYGIDAIDISGTVVASIPDIFSNHFYAERFLARCNVGELSLIHLMDVIYDVLIEQSEQ